MSITTTLPKDPIDLTPGYHTLWVPHIHLQLFVPPFVVLRCSNPIIQSPSCVGLVYLLRGQVQEGRELRHDHGAFSRLVEEPNERPNLLIRELLPNRSVEGTQIRGRELCAGKGEDRNGGKQPSARIIRCTYPQTGSDASHAHTS